MKHFHCTSVYHVDMKKSFLVRPLLIAACLPMLAGCVVRERHARHVIVAPVPGEVIVVEPSSPPPLQVEVIPVCPSPAHLWIPGCWEWRGHWVWTGGRWAVRPHVSAVWLAPHWEHRSHGHVWVVGRWR